LAQPPHGLSRITPIRFRLGQAIAAPDRHVCFATKRSAVAPPSSADGSGEDAASGRRLYGRACFTHLPDRSDRFFFGLGRSVYVLIW
jgi:hypothetical protein